MGTDLEEKIIEYLGIHDISIPLPNKFGLLPRELPFSAPRVG
jgi:hypothetical protein